ncbi:SHOCT domain-containing protein [Rhodococcoides yunnanense]|uniref:SHOCT domain-containing protein n=1 Tax=Rhodococcoides yunnanense TaxID=278209 RepID=A0ABU4BE32_9NOCA|nr:SHOCT domain-containing protein [Rhodococcus yunnanensis]MDV6262483.1 SHOCT domain-containing protein [Rhodococcus yunnanensis]
MEASTRSAGVTRPVWVLFLITAPFFTALVYLIVNGSSMTKRQVAALQHAKDQQEDYIKHVAGRSASEEIAHAKALLDNGTIDQDEFRTLKAKALS